MLLPPTPSPLLSPACRATACWMRCSLRSVSLVLLFILNLVQCCLSIICRLTHVNNTCDVNTSGIGCYPTELTFLRPFCSTILRKENSSACSATKTFWCENDNHLALHEPLATANGVASIERTCVHAMMLWAIVLFPTMYIFTNLNMQHLKQHVAPIVTSFPDSQPLLLHGRGAQVGHDLKSFKHRIPKLHAFVRVFWLPQPPNRIVFSHRCFKGTLRLILVLSRGCNNDVVHATADNCFWMPWITHSCVNHNASTSLVPDRRLGSRRDVRKNGKKLCRLMLPDKNSIFVRLHEQSKRACACNWTINLH